MGTQGWLPGQSGNPKGRPKKTRALTEILEKAGATMVDMPDGSRTSARRIVARAVWDLATTGEATLPNGTHFFAGKAEDWLPVVKFIFAQLDGPPPQQISGPDGGPLQVKHTLDGDTAGNIFDILAAAGCLGAVAGDAEDDGLHPTQTAGETGGVPPPAAS
jgi:hypothetical protein